MHNQADRRVQPNKDGKGKGVYYFNTSLQLFYTCGPFPTIFANM